MKAEICCGKWMTLRNGFQKNNEFTVGCFVAVFQCDECGEVKYKKVRRIA